MQQEWIGGIVRRWEVATAVSAYTLLKFVHVFAAIVAVGFNVSYGIWLSQAARQPQHREHVLRGIRLLDQRFANPAYGVLLITGLIMVWVGDLNLTAFWIATSLGLFVLSGAIGFFGFTPTLRRQIDVLAAEGSDSPAFAQLSRKATLLGILTTLPILVIVFLMVTKPTFS